MVLMNIGGWLRSIIVLKAFFAFFLGVYFLAWGDSFTSPAWHLLQEMPGGMAGPGFTLLGAGALFVRGLETRSRLPRLAGSIISGAVYIGIGGFLLASNLERPLDSGTPSWAMWAFSGLISLVLAGLMWTIPGRIWEQSE